MTGNHSAVNTSWNKYFVQKTVQAPDSTSLVADGMVDNQLLQSIILPWPLSDKVAVCQRFRQFHCMKTDKCKSCRISTQLSTDATCTLRRTQNQSFLKRTVRSKQHGWFKGQGPDLQNILRQSYGYLTIMAKLRLTYDRRLIYQNLSKNARLFLGTIYMQNRKIVGDNDQLTIILNRNLGTL